MKKLIFILLVLALLFTAGCTKETSQQESEDAETEDAGYISDIDSELDTSDLDNLDEDLDLGWI